MSPRPDDDALARRTEEERAELGLTSFDPDEVPAATDAAPAYDPAEDEEYQKGRAEVDRESEEGELRPITAENPDPPSHYDRS